MGFLAVHISHHSHPPTQHTAANTHSLLPIPESVFKGPTNDLTTWTQWRRKDNPFDIGMDLCASYRIPRANSKLVLPRPTLDNPHIAVPPDSALPTPLHNSLFRRPLPLRKRYFLALATQVSPPGHTWPRQTTTSRNNLARLSGLPQGPDIRRGQRGSQLLR